MTAKKTNSSISIFLIFILVFSMFTINANADTVSEITFKITDVTLTDYSNEDLGEDVAKDADVRISYTFEIDNLTGDTINAGDTFTYDMPDEIDVAYPTSVEVRDTSDELILTAAITTDNVITVTFTDYTKAHSNVSGTFWFDFSFLESNIGSGEPVNIGFPIDASAGQITVPVDFDQPIITPTIDKSRTYNSDTKEITWTLTANSEETAIDNMRIVDSLSSNTEFVSGSATLNGVPLADGDVYDSVNGSIDYSFTSQVTSEQVLVFKTKVTSAAILAATGTNVSVSNQAILYDDGNPINSPIRNINIPVELIDKSGAYDGDNTEIDYTITVNSSSIDINNATVEDTLVTGLTLKESSILLNGASMTEGTNAGQYELDGQKITFNLGDISEELTITFSAGIDETYFITQSSDGSDYEVDNTAVLNGDGVNYNNSADSGVIGVGTETIEKAGVVYDPYTGIASWQVTVNPNTFTLNNAIFTDAINGNMDYIGGTFNIVNNTDPGNNLGAFNYDSASDTITYTFPNTITDTYTITFDTQVVNDIFNGGGDNGRDSVNLTNTGVLNTTTGRRQSSGTVTATKDSVVEKRFLDYNWETNVATWAIDVNSANYNMANMVLTDSIISDNHTYVTGSFSVLNLTTDESLTTPDIENSDGFTYTFPTPTNDAYTITFKTQVNDDDLYENGNIRLDNSLVLDHDGIPFTIYDQKRQNISSEIVGKSAAYTLGNDYIDWTIVTNKNEMPITDAVISDTLQEGLEMDTTSLVMFEADTDSEGNVTKGSEITLNYPTDFTYDYSTRTLSVNLPTSNQTYIIEFRTYVIDKSRSPFTNSVSMMGTVVDETNVESGVAVAFSGSGGAGTGETGAIEIHKISSDDSSESLEGATFNLYDRYGIYIRTGTTDSNGKLTFERIRFDTPYTVREITAPTGYLLSETSHVFTIEDDGDPSDIDIIEYDWDNTPITANVRLNKIDDNDNPVKGTVFTLYDETGTNPIQDEGENITATSDENGLVEFEDVFYGNYQIKETTTPEGYSGYSGDPITVNIGEDDNGKTLMATPYTILNTVFKGSIELLKVDMDDKPLEGAVFTLYDSWGKEVATSTSGTDGIVSFSDVAYGKYTIVETTYPDGYALNTKETITATISEEGAKVNASPYVIYNTVQLSPETGDNIMPIIIILFVTTLFLLLISLVYEPKKFNK